VSPSVAAVSAAIKGRRKSCAVTIAAAGLPGRPRASVELARGEPGGLAGFHGNSLEHWLEAVSGEGGADDIVVADGGAADRNDDVAGCRETLADVGFVVPADA